MTPRPSAPALALIACALALAVAGVLRADEAKEKDVAATRPRPPIDLAAPKATRTATFALG